MIASAGWVDDGTIITLGQLADTFVTNGVDEIHEGAVPCWTASETPCPGDLDGDRDIDLADLAQLLAHYGMTEGATYEDGDLDGDGDVDLGDLAAILSVYGAVCP